MSLTDAILTRARDLGFDLAGIIPIGPPPHGEAFVAWLTAGYHGEMAYLGARAVERFDPGQFAPGAQSIILLVANYAPTLRSGNPVAVQQSGFAVPPVGRIARYARGLDYHDVLKPKLYALDAFIRQQTGRQTPGKVFVDSAPVLERDFAEQAGLGFIGRNCCLITPGLGSWTLLAGVMVPERLATGNWKLEAGESQRGFSPGIHAEDNTTVREKPSAWIGGFSRLGGRREKPAEASNPEPRTAVYNAGCGRCTRCLDACPTQAFVGPHVLDARRCISYLTIELRGPIPRELRPLMGNWVFGCDVCQEVCPYNKWASASATEGPLGAAYENQAGWIGGFSRSGGHCGKPAEASNPEDRTTIFGTSISLSELLALDDAGFRARFRGTPVMRARRRGLVRNACVAAGNSGDASLVPLLGALLADPEPLVRGHAAWALARIGGTGAAGALQRAWEAEADTWVRDEFAGVLASSD